MKKKQKNVYGSVAAAGMDVHYKFSKVSMRDGEGQLVRLQTATKNRISAIFHRHGLFHEFSDLFGAEGRALASYSLLAPISNDTGEPKSGGSPVGRHLGVRGNRTLKWAFIEAAHGAVRKGGRCPLGRQASL